MKGNKDFFFPNNLSISEGILEELQWIHYYSHKYMFMCRIIWLLGFFPSFLSFQDVGWVVPKRKKKLPCTTGRSQKAQALLLVMVFLVSGRVTSMRFLNLLASPYRGIVGTVICPSTSHSIAGRFKCDNICEKHSKLQSTIWM